MLFHLQLSYCGMFLSGFVSLYQIYGVFVPLLFFSVCPMWKLKSPLCPALTKLRKLSTEVTNVTKMAISLGEFSTVQSELTGSRSPPVVSTSKWKVLLQEKWVFLFFFVFVNLIGGGVWRRQHTSNTKKPCSLNPSLLKRFFVCLFSFVAVCNTRQFSSQEDLS